MQQRIGGYELSKLLGEGGMGEVWLAHDTFADRPVALKFIRPELLTNPGFRMRFSNEAKTLGKLEHERIVTLYAVLEEGDRLGLVLRFIDGKALADIIDERGPLPLNFVHSCAKDILPALDFAHQQGIIHRDIKPQNILVDRRERSFLTDFGIAVAAFAERGTVTGHAIGTPHYMSPEQIRTPREIRIETGGHRTDIYSFGVVLFEMLTGQLPFGKDSGLEDVYLIYQGHCGEKPPSLRSINESIPPALEEVVLWSLEKDPAQRPQSCMELLKHVEAAIEGHAPARLAGGRGGTVLEQVPSEPPKQAGQAADAPREAKAAKAGFTRRKLPQWAWLSVGALLIAGGVGYTVLTPSPKPVTPTPTQPARQAQTSTTAPPPTRTAGVNGAVRSSNVSTQAPPPQIRKVQMPVPQGPTPEQIRAQEAQKEAQNEYAQATSLFQAGKYCDSEEHFNKGMALFPDKKYQEDQRQAAIGCNSQ